MFREWKSEMRAWKISIQILDSSDGVVGGRICIIMNVPVTLMDLCERQESSRARCWDHVRNPPVWMSQSGSLRLLMPIWSINISTNQTLVVYVYANCFRFQQPKTTISNESGLVLTPILRRSLFIKQTENIKREITCFAQWFYVGKYLKEFPSIIDHIVDVNGRLAHRLRRFIDNGLVMVLLSWRNNYSNDPFF